MVVFSAMTGGAVPAWDGDDSDIQPVAGALVLTALQEAAAAPDAFVPQVIMI